MVPGYPPEAPGGKSTRAKGWGRLRPGYFPALFYRAQIGMLNDVRGGSNHQLAALWGATAGAHPTPASIHHDYTDVARSRCDRRSHSGRGLNTDLGVALPTQRDRPPPRRGERVDSPSRLGLGRPQPAWAPCAEEPDAWVSETRLESSVRFTRGVWHARFRWIVWIR